jgi:RimJ/RimL family protein N-acetyltransferase
MSGGQIYLAALAPGDAGTITRWLNDPEITQYLDDHREIKSLERVREDVEKYIKTGAAFAIFDKETDIMTGYCVLNGDWIDILVGEKEYLSKNHGDHGAEALSLMLDFGFNLRNCACITVSAYSHNAEMLACFGKAGFKKTAVKRERLLRGREKYDEIYFDMLASEYFERSKTDG